MLKSMTGYGRAERTLDGRTVTVELRSVNNRYLDCNVRMPRLYLFAEEGFKAQVQKTISRGKVDVFITLEGAGTQALAVSVNRPVADGYYAALRELDCRKTEFPDMSAPAINAAYPGRCQSLTQVLSTSDARVTALSRQP